MGIFLASRRKAMINPDAVPYGFNLADIFRGGVVPQGMGAWSNVLQRLSTGGGIVAGELNQAMDASEASAFLDPQGLDLAARRMSVGERVVLQVPTALGYGSVG